MKRNVISAVKAANVAAVNRDKVLLKEGYVLKTVYYIRSGMDACCFVHPDYLEAFDKASNEELDDFDMFPPFSIVWV